MKIKSLKQRDSEACGPTVIKMVVDYFGLSHSLNELAKISNYKKREGLSNKELVQVLKKLGLKTNEKNSASWADLKKLNTKSNVIILSWMFKGYIGHFSVLEKVTKNHIYLAEPHNGMSF